MTRTSRLIRMVGLIALFASTFQLLSTGQAAAQTVKCDDYSSANAAQFALEINPNLAGALDPDGNGIACDDEASGQSDGTDRTATDLQLPDMGDPAPTPAGQQGQDQPDVDAIDQQPIDLTGGLELPTPPATDQPTGPLGLPDPQALAGRIGSDRPAWETIWGAPFSEDPGSRPEIVLTEWGPMPTASAFVTLWFNDQAFIILISAETSWSGAEAAPIILELLPPDITTLPDGEILDDDSLLIPMFSEQLATVIDVEEMADAGAPGMAGDLYLLLITNGGDEAVEIEIGVGNGDNVREDINGQGATTPVVPTPTLELGGASSIDETIFLQETRVEVSLLLSQYDEFLEILLAGSFTDAEIDRLTEILSGWIALDTALPDAPAEHAGIATQLQQVRTDLGTGALLVVSSLAAGGEDTTTIDESLQMLDFAHDTLVDLDQQLTALGV